MKLLVALAEELDWSLPLARGDARTEPVDFRQVERASADCIDANACAHGARSANAQLQPVRDVARV